MLYRVVGMVGREKERGREREREREHGVGKVSLESHPLYVCLVCMPYIYRRKTQASAMWLILEYVLHIYICIYMYSIYIRIYVYACPYVHIRGRDAHFGTFQIPL